MIKARMHSGLIVLGLEAENIALLMSHHPMVVDLSEVGGTDRVVIMYGTTKEAIMEEINAAVKGKNADGSTYSEAEGIADLNARIRQLDGHDCKGNICRREWNERNQIQGMGQAIWWPHGVLGRDIRWDALRAFD